jgi:uronate dehydrogenase
MAAIDQQSKGKVLITGSSGILGSRLYAALQANGWEVVGLGLADSVSQGGPGRDGASETNRGFIDLECDLRSFCPSLEGFTHVVHLAGVGSPDASFEEVLQGNVVATQKVLEAAKRSGTVRRVVLASTNHVQTGATMVGGAPGTLAEDPYRALVTLDDPVDPDSFYATSKIQVEAMGALYGKTWRCFDVVALRIGWCLYDDPTELCGTQYEAYLRAMWLSRRDWEGFAMAALTTTRVMYGYVDAYAVSNNSTRVFDLRESIDLLGYSPQDSSDDFDWSRPAPAPAPAPDDEVDPDALRRARRERRRRVVPTQDGHASPVRRAPPSPPATWS